MGWCDLLAVLLFAELRLGRRAPIGLGERVEQSGVVLLGDRLVEHGDLGGERRVLRVTTIQKQRNWSRVC